MTRPAREWLPPGTVARHVVNEVHRDILARWLPHIEKAGGLAPAGFLDDLALVVEQWAGVAWREASAASPGLERENKSAD